MQRSKLSQGFSLVELSIVLVILGLLTGGILGGQSLMRAAELRSVTQEFQQYQIAVNTFQDKYFAIPGDFSNAEAFWGTMATGTCPNATAGTGTQTCDGDGDGNISNPAAASQTGEFFTFWQHLVNAGLIEGNYTGIAGGGGIVDVTLGVNAPHSKLNNGGWSVSTSPNFTGDTARYALDYGNYMLFGTKVTNTHLIGAALTPEEAWNIDTKVDDGKPARGKVIARYWNNACASADDGTHANNDLQASYKLSDSSTQCALYFRHAF